MEGQKEYRRKIAVLQKRRESSAVDVDNPLDRISLKVE